MAQTVLAWSQGRQLDISPLRAAYLIDCEQPDQRLWRATNRFFVPTCPRANSSFRGDCFQQPPLIVNVHSLPVQLKVQVHDDSVVAVVLIVIRNPRPDRPL